MDMAHLCKCVAHGVVDGPSADLPAFDMRNGYAQSKCDCSRSEHLVSIGNEQQYVGSHSG